MMTELQQRSRERGAVLILVLLAAVAVGLELGVPFADLAGGLGASGGTYLEDIFYLNTFSVGEYIGAVNARSTAIALSLDLTQRMQMAGWLYWRIYETQCKKADFQRRFGESFDSVYGKYFKALGLLGFSVDDGKRITLTDRGTYWLHALEDLFSIEYISRLWGMSKEEPRPQKVLL
mgnify:CR=1 FL=1